MKKAYKAKDGRNQFVKRKAHIKGVENFWGTAKLRRAKFRGLNPGHVRPHLKECEFRFNHRHDKP
jgi:transposase